MEPKRTCPECHLIFDADLPETGVLVCPLCNSVVPAVPAARSVPTALSASASASSGRQVLRGVLAVGTVFLLVGGVGYAYHLLAGIGHRAAAVQAPTASAPHVSESPSPNEVFPVLPPGPSPPTLAPRLQLQTNLRQKFDDVAAVLNEFGPQLPRSPQVRLPKLPPLPKEISQPLTLPERINQAIDRGLAYLRGPHTRQKQYHRCLGLIGLTLLECGIPADDPFVQQMAASIRASERELTQTYELTLAILFLDRLGDPSDRARIRTFGQRLLSGQLDCGAWTYLCLVNGRPTARTHLWDPGWHQISYRGDNSNTQFAILGLWVAQRYGVPARSALLATAQYFQNTQAGEGSWSYHAKASANRDSMTCAGLMSLAMHYGVGAGQGRDIRPDHPISIQDPAVLRGLRYLARSLDKITVGGNHIAGVEARDPFYFLWSLERMAVIYDLEKIGEYEWYPWAAQMLVEAQGRDGRWLGIADPAATCFALLVLKRSNLARDLKLAVKEPPSPSLPDVARPTILQGPDAFLGQTAKPHGPAQPLGPSIMRTPRTK